MKRTLLTWLFLGFAMLVSNSIVAQDVVLQDDVLMVDSLLEQQDTVEVKLSTQDYLNMLSVPDVETGAVINVYQDSAILAMIGKRSVSEAEEVKGFRTNIFE